ncbi:hypothetical protein ACIGO6_38515 [Streptomyces sp. NPDC053750]|uniref:hypothetical protein n=1 Tax=Streptomyces sp. NPDC053750 TaxID=3365714 RepID=UPI0037D03576
MATGPRLPHVGPPVTASRYFHTREYTAVLDIFEDSGALVMSDEEVGVSRSFGLRKPDARRIGENQLIGAAVNRFAG